LIKAKFYKTLFVLLGFCFLYTTTFAQLVQQNYFVKNFTKKELRVSSQSWCVAQDLKGQLYIANNHGILVNNGQQWKDVLLTLSADARSIATDSKGRIYVGGNGEIGFLYYNAKGKIIYASYNNQLTEEEQRYSDVWTTLVLDDGTVFFQSPEYLFFFKNGKKIASISSENGFHKSFKVGSNILVRENGKGLQLIKNNSLQPLLGGEIFADQKIDAILQVTDKQWIIAGRGKGLLKADLIDVSGKTGISVQPFNQTLSEELIKNQIYHAVKNPNGGYVMTTLLNGVYFLDNNFNLISILNKTNGLADNKVFYSFFDTNKNLWLATESGVSFVETSLPLSYWGENEGLEGIGQDLLISNDAIYVATGLGLYKITSQNKFEKISGSPIEVWSLLDYDKKIFIGASSGLYLINQDKTEKLNYLNTHFIGTDNVGNMVQAGDGFINIFAKNNYYQPIKEYNFTGLVQQIFFDKKSIWVATRDDGILYIDSLGKTHEIIQSKRGLDLDGANFLKINNHFLIAGSGGIYTANTSQTTPIIENFYVDAQIDTGTRFNIFKINTSTSGDIAYISDYEGQKQQMWFLQKLGNKYVNKSKVLTRVSEGRINKILFNANSLWMLGDDGLFEYYINKPIPNNKIFPVIRSIISNNDTIMFGSFRTAVDSSVMQFNQPEGNIPNLSYHYRDFKISFSATAFEGKEYSMFSYYLEGFDNNYSEWQTDPFRNYTNLKEGAYTFHLKAKDVFGNISPETSFTFIIAPPWYRTLPAYILYVILAVLGIYSIVQLNIRRLKNKNIQLEVIITERTEEIRNQKNEIEIQKKEITDSINYAKRIQGAIMPSPQQIEKDFSNTFVLFKPKDIVSGDFYYLSKIQKDGKEIDLIAAADCTGHGVPGAFMSMIGLKTLEQAIFDLQETDADKILYQLNIGVNKFLRQNQNKTHDGMEIALCIFDYQTKKMQFSMANRPLWLVRNNELIEYKPTKLPIGGVQESTHEYILNEIEIQSGDVIYISSDGYADQFDSNDKKMTKKRFKEELLKIAALPMQEQYNYLDQFFTNWKGSAEQIDDVLVIGVRA